MRAQMTKNAIIVPDGRQGRLLPQARRPTTRARCATRSSASYVALHRGAARRHRQPRRRRGRAPRRRARPRRGRHLPRRRGRQGHRDVLRHGQRDRGAARLLAGRRVRLRRLGGLRPQGARHHRRAARGSRSSATSASSASTPRPTSFTAVGIGDMSGDVFGNGMLLSAARSSSSPPTTTATSSSTPTPTRRARSPSASGCSSCRGRRGTTTTAR